MSTTPNEPGGTRPSMGMPSIPSGARLPIPGNAEFALYLAALIVAWIVVWTTDSLTANHWFQFFTITTAIYILSRGIAKASRVLEQ